MSAGDMTIELTREELYERVWTTPMRKLAVEFGLSDVGLAKVCRRHKIPWPARGYWANTLLWGRNFKQQRATVQNSSSNVLPVASCTLPSSPVHGPIIRGTGEYTDAAR